MSLEDRTLVLSDFDGTITRRDTFFHFIFFSKGKARFAAGMLPMLPVLLLYATGLLTAQRAKEVILAFFFRGTEKTELEKAGEKFCDHLHQAGRFRTEILGGLLQHTNRGDTVAVVSASADAWVRPFCQRHGFLCISTRLDYSDGKFTGRFAGLNCQGAEKKNRVLQQFPGMPFGQVIAFGNSPGDEAMMELAMEKIWVK